MLIVGAATVALGVRGPLAESAIRDDCTRSPRGVPGEDPQGTSLSNGFRPCAHGLIPSNNRTED